ncbi:hypothetical protein MPSI1_002312 [Malassezia psittaci]|uniref:Uncharacterized protein n=1 Tax=Malassezia psittaci TaxID=1821823 RepID=A0AAF0JEF4_9BASI|nr:hypothetical protein MPSI1_002312 [Malassezia psittaci]
MVTIACRFQGVRGFRTRASARNWQRHADQEQQSAYGDTAWVPADTPQRLVGLRNPAAFRQRDSLENTQKIPTHNASPNNLHQSQTAFSTDNTPNVSSWNAGSANTSQIRRHERRSQRDVYGYTNTASTSNTVERPYKEEKIHFPYEYEAFADMAVPDYTPTKYRKSQSNSLAYHSTPTEQNQQQQAFNDALVERIAEHSPSIADSQAQSAEWNQAEVSETGPSRSVDDYLSTPVPGDHDRLQDQAVQQIDPKNNHDRVEGINNDPSKLTLTKRLGVTCSTDLPRSRGVHAPLRGVHDVYDWRTMASSQREIGMNGRPASQLIQSFDPKEWITRRRSPTLSLLLRTAHAAAQRTMHLSKKGKTTSVRQLVNDEALTADPLHAQHLAVIKRVREYQDQWRDALSYERSFNEAELDALRARPKQELIQLGLALDGLEAYWQAERHYGRRVAVFKLPGAKRLPRHKFTPGTIVDLRPTDGRHDWFVNKPAVAHRSLALVDQAWQRKHKQETEMDDSSNESTPAIEAPKIPHISGELLDCNATQIRVRFNEAFDQVDLDTVESWRMDRGVNRVVEERTDAALEALLYDPDNVVQASTPHRRYALRGTPLRDMLVGVDPSFRSTAKDGIFARDIRIRSWYERYSHENPIVLDSDPDLQLNSSQMRAIAMMLKEPLSLVQGPPGTGKTRTLVQTVSLLKQEFHVPQPILLAAHTNVAVDNLVRACLARGLKVVRAGTSAATDSSLAAHTLEAHIARHPRHPELMRMQSVLKQRQTERMRLESELRIGGKQGPSGDAADAAEMRKHDASQSNLRDQAESAREQLVKVKRKIGALVSQCHALRSEIASSVLHDADVVAATMISAGSSQLDLIDFPMVFVDEGSMATEPIALIALMKGCAQLALIGDHRQLPPVLRSDGAKQHGLAVSLFERLIQQGTPDASSKEAQNLAQVPSIMLHEQFRMHPTLAAFPNAAFYQGALRNAASTQKRQPLNSIYAARDSNALPKAVTFLNHAPVPATSAPVGSGGSATQSPYNAPQADLTMALLCDLLVQNPDLRGDQIGIVTPYEAQVRLFRQVLGASAFRSDFGIVHGQRMRQSGFVPTFSEYAMQAMAHVDLSRREQLQAIEVHTVDGFEGREKQVMIFSSVKSSGGAWRGSARLQAAMSHPTEENVNQLAALPNEQGGYVGFLADARRMNVALTRAQNQLYVLGNLDTLLSARLTARSDASVQHTDVEVIRAYARWLLLQGCVVDVEHVYDGLLTE